jgi:hypothetical protein
MLGAAVAFMGMGEAAVGATKAVHDIGPVLRTMRSSASPRAHMTRRSTLHVNVRDYRYEPFTPAPMAAYYDGEMSRQVARQHQRRLGKAVESRLKREARRAA